MAEMSDPPSPDAVEETPTHKSKKSKGKSSPVAEDDSSSVELVSVTTHVAGRQKSGTSVHEKSQTPAKKRKHDNVQRSPSVELVTSPPQTKKAVKPTAKRLRLVPQSPTVIRHSVSPDPPLDDSDNESIETKEAMAHYDVDDEVLRNIYKKLPRFPICELLPFGSGSQNQRAGGSSAAADMTLLRFSALLQALPSLQSQNFQASVNFNGSAQFINPTRDSITAVVVDGHSLILSGGGPYKRPAVFLTTGVVQSCNLIQHTYSQGIRVKRLQLVPMAYEYERLLGWFGLCFGTRQLYGYLTPDVALSFSTRKEAPLNQGSPKKGNNFFVRSKMATATATTSTPAKPLTYPQFLNFEDSVPIYDCRNQRFRFDKDALNTVASLPLFEGDLPTGAIVSVAYAANSMPYAPSMNAPKVDLGIFFNILFVLFLAELPEESEGGLEEEG